ncbi:hypothetical protein VCRA2110O318_10200 [Vibrio crassostreae]|nr:hypothetical protein VCRA2117O328_20201 [Vibrio crassostreae]CAK2292631.1 hypothetical protein VCRA2110O318_10200 [Vibrio crassostreae]
MRAVSRGKKYISKVYFGRYLELKLEHVDRNVLFDKRNRHCIG